MGCPFLERRIARFAPKDGVLGRKSPESFRIMEKLTSPCRMNLNLPHQLCDEPLCDRDVPHCLWCCEELEVENEFAERLKLRAA